MSKKVTLADVAAKAGVAVSTASKALRNSAQVSGPTRAKVLKAAAELSFSLNERQKQSQPPSLPKSVGLVTSDLDGQFSMPILIGAESYFGVESIPVFLCNAGRDPALEQHHIDNLLAYGVKGLLMVGWRTDPRPALTSCPVPVVYANQASLDPHDCSVVTDNEDIGRLMVRHLVEGGSKKIVLIAGDPAFQSSVRRLKGEMAELDSRGLAAVRTVRYGGWNEETGRRTMIGLLDEGIDFDGVACGNDEIARGCLDILHDRHIAVPDRVSVVGVDNRTVIVGNSRPPLTSVDLNLKAIGTRAASCLADMLDGRGHQGIECVKGTLVQRASTRMPL